MATADPKSKSRSKIFQELKIEQNNKNNENEGGREGVRWIPQRAMCSEAPDIAIIVFSLRSSEEVEREYKSRSAIISRSVTPNRFTDDTEFVRLFAATLREKGEVRGEQDANADGYKGRRYLFEQPQEMR